MGIVGTHYEEMGTRSSETYTAPIIFTFADPACSSLGGGADASGLHRRTCGAPPPRRPCYTPPLLSLRPDPDTAPQSVPESPCGRGFSGVRR